jgi:hypothetical protein
MAVEYIKNAPDKKRNKDFQELLFKEFSERNIPIPRKQ